MNKTAHIDNYKQLFEELRVMVLSTEEKILESDSFFSGHANFFTKSFVVTMCAYLESYLKDGLMVIIVEMNNRLDQNRIPYNLVKWSLSSDSDKKQLKDKELQFKNLKIDIKRKELDEFISGNPYRTESLFKNFGIDLGKDEIFKEQKDRLNAIIGKRNSIIHHNDEASDISLHDIVEHIDFFIGYVENVDRLIVEHIQ
ncbi:MAG: HEPN domain-containing protein [Methylococcales bacterium]|nr:HEPN domain-containing protein [Methylococcales bacterium]